MGVVARPAKLGLALLPCGVFANTIRVLAPPIASDAAVDEGPERLEAAFDARQPERMARRNEEGR
jgi:4-aminobutyrate aminotransferase-like enzyme